MLLRGVAAPDSGSEEEESSDEDDDAYEEEDQSSSEDDFSDAEEEDSEDEFAGEDDLRCDQTRVCASFDSTPSRALLTGLRGWFQ